MGSLPDNSPPEIAPRKTHILWPLGVALLLALILVPVPSVPRNTPADLSLGAVLNLAHQQNLQFGKDLICTYGPLGFLTFFCFSPHAGAWSLLTLLILTFVNCAGVCLLGWRLRWPVRILLLSLFVWAGANNDTRTDFVIDAGVFCWVCLGLVESGRRLTWCLAVLALLAAFLCLAKASFLVTATVTLLLLGAELLIRGERRAAFTMASCFPIAFMLGWLLMGQSLSNLNSFLQLSYSVVQGYNQVMGLNGQQWVRNAGQLVLGLCLVSLAIRSLNAFAPARPSAVLWARRLIAVACMACLTLANWKHGFIRLDPWHTPIALGFAPLILIAAELLPVPSLLALRCARLAGLVAGVLAVAVLQQVFFPPWTASLASPWRALRANLGCLFAPSAYENRMRAELEDVRQQDQLPRLAKIVGSETVDVFGQFQAYALDNNLNYHPRPAFQSYAACNRRLMALNEAHYLSSSAPRFVLFELNALDEKFPALEDARVLRDLFINYAPVDQEGRYVLFQKQRTELPKLQLLSETTVQPGEKFVLPAQGQTNLWLEIRMEPTWRGWLRQFIHKPTTVRLEAWGAGSPGLKLLIRRRAPPEMLKAGFLASPLLTSTEDALGLYQTNSVTLPVAYSIHLLPEDRKYWQLRIEVRAFQITNFLGAN